MDTFVFMITDGESCGCCRRLDVHSVYKGGSCA